jgi:predicted  nucleic acid-binding Zn-ribbon protein
MKNFKKLFFFLSIICSPALFYNCSEDYSDEINSIKADITSINARLDSLTNAIKTVSSQITNLEVSLKTKIDKTNTRIDSVTSALVTLKAQVNTNTTNIANTSNSISDIITSINKLTADVKTINTSLTKTNEDLKKKTDSIIFTIDSLMNSIKTVNSDLSNNINNVNSNLSAQILVLNNNYKEILFNYLELLKIVKSTPRIVEINGSVFKGSFLRGSLLFLYELDTNLNQTGRSFNTTIDDDYGNFDLKAQNLSGKLVRVVGDGFYWNEVLNENSSTRISLTGICKIDSNETVNVNVLTHLERARVEYLYNTNKVSFDSAKSQAVTEVLRAFGFENTGIKRAEKVGVVGVGDESKILLAISTLMQGYRTESEVTQIMNDFANEIRKDGKLDDVTIGNDLETHLYYVDTTTVLNNFKIKYRKLYNADTVNSVDMRFVKNFQNNTTYTKDKELIDYPIQSTGLSGSSANIFRKDVTSFTGTRPYQSVNITRKGLSVKIEAYKADGTKLGSGVFSACAGCNSNWTYDQRYDGTTNTIIPTWTSTGQLIHLDMGGFAQGTYLLKYFEGPDTNKLSFSKTITISY